MIRVLVADDHPVVRSGIKDILADLPDIAIAGEAENGHEALDKVRNESVDVVLLDISMPGKSGIDVLHRIRRERPDVHVLVLSIYAEDQYAIRLLRAGASGYMTKESAPDQLVTAIRDVAKGKKHVSPHMADILVDEVLGSGERPLHETLSDREYQIFCLLAAGNTVSEIARDLALSVKTVSTYRTRILEKMDMTKNAELTYYAVKNQLVE